MCGVDTPLEAADGPAAERWEYMFVLAVETDRAARLSTVRSGGEVAVIG